MTTPREALERLAEGNERFLSGRMEHRDLLSEARDTATGQSPFAAVLGCMDSRVPPELVFDQGIGDVFSVRIAGNFANTDIAGSMEFAAAVVGVSLILVLGHTDCGAVKGVCAGTRLGNLTATLDNLAPALEAVRATGLESDEAALVQAVAVENVHQTVRGLLERSPILREAVEAGRLDVVGAMHDVATGRVTFLGDEAR